jgi:hypothetical protein
VRPTLIDMKLAFMLVVTAYLMARVFAEAAGGLDAALEVAIYALTAGFGLEFLAASWPSLWADRASRS